jgi:REP element-mobilizing transposase RayT
VQLTLARTGGVGGRRKGAGRKPTPGKRRNVPHRVRPRLDGKNHPVHVTVRARHGVGVPSLRCEIVRALLRGILQERSDEAFQLVHFSIQHDHLHLLVEAVDAKTLARGMAGLLIRLARRINGLIGRCGAVWAGRYHRHDLCTPTEVAHAIVYVLHNGKKHGLARREEAWLDPFSSADDFDGWVDIGVTVATPRSRTWLLRIGYRRARVEIRSTSAPRLAA